MRIEEDKLYLSQSDFGAEMFSGIWGQLHALSKSNETKIDLLKWQNGDSSFCRDEQARIAQSTAQFLEQRFCEVNFSSPKLDQNSQIAQIGNFERETMVLTEKIQIHWPQQYALVMKQLVQDEATKAFPYMVVFLLMRAGFDFAINHYCAQVEALNSFGQLYMAYKRQQLTNEHVERFFKKTPTEDICLDAILCIMMGRDFDTAQKSQIFCDLII
jgi:hypothetical protein